MSRAWFFLGGWIFHLFPSSARGRAIRLTAFILVIFALALAALAWQNVSIEVPRVFNLERNGTGPLGLKLGLDLRGGGQLLYQADTGTRIDVRFDPTSASENAVNLQDFESALRDLKFGEDELVFDEFTVEARNFDTIRIKTTLLDEEDPRRTELVTRMSETFDGIAGVKFNSIEEPTVEQMEGVLAIINRRVNLFGTEEPIIQRFGDDRIIVQLPGASGSVSDIIFIDPLAGEDVDTLRAILTEAGFEDIDLSRRNDRTFRVKSDTVSSAKQKVALDAITESLGTVFLDVTSGIDDAKSLIGQTAQLEFKSRTCTGGISPISGDCLLPLDADIGLTGDDLTRAFVTTDPITGSWAVSVAFNGRGSDIFSDLTEEIVGRNDRRIAIFLDEILLIDVVARAHIRNGQSQITGNFSREEARQISIQLESGRLPVPLKLIQENDVDALLGSESLRNSLIAGIVGLGLVMAFMIVYYRMAGVVASVSLLFYAVLVLSIFKLIPITLTLSHIGGFILSIGMAVDANVLIFERMKEELRIGRTLASSMEVGFNRAWPAIRDGNVSTIITCLVLLWFGDRLGGGLVTGFALSLLIGVGASMFTAVIVSRNLLQLLAWIGLGHRIGLFTPEGSPFNAPTLGGGR